MAGTKKNMILKRGILDAVSGSNTVLIITKSGVIRPRMRNVKKYKKVPSVK